MKPDSYIPFYGSDFFFAMSGQSDAVIVAYLRCIWHYWSHYHCEGLPDNEEMLRRLCHCDREDWNTVRDVIFDNEQFFTQDANGLWHQKRASDEWQKSMGRYQAVCKKTSAATIARLKKYGSNSAKRAIRVAAAREKGTHTFPEWQKLYLEFQLRCVRCGQKGDKLQKDHILPIYRGGADDIENIQPLCGSCNSSKGPESINWVAFRRKHGFGVSQAFIKKESANFEVSDNQES